MAHMSCLSKINPAYSPQDSCLFSATTLALGHSAKEIQQELANYLGRKEDDFHFIQSFAIPNSLWKVSDFQDLKEEAARRNIFLAGDYTQFPSLQAALASGRMAAERVVEKTN